MRRGVGREGWSKGVVGEVGNQMREVGQGGAEGARGGREEAMMLGRQRSSVEEGRFEVGMVDEGNERGRDGPKHGRREGGSERTRD